MGNQQGKALDLDLAWLAGFIDGEGSILLRRHGGTRARELDIDLYYPGITICNTHEPTLEAVVDILKRHQLPYFVSRRKALKGSDSWAIEIRGMRRCRVWLTVLMPYLRTKRDQAEWALEFIDSRLSVGKKAGYTEREQQLLELLRKRNPVRPHRLNACQS